ncbi:hypothetical protein P43SY_004920 [Pythium insidiosum]|uniref:Uncharacterized protein n=1 Tax=Pythium insidiosum TaxID=114742 RepID=A0AAD5M6X2_PYTIN|nr:hypothetical protein P43SY_004920 [Pythium insidiosum]KAJ0409777.1 hypothetical protein ATCC90586_001090 [Pythium insidiosum]
MWEDLTYIPEAAQDVDDSELLWFDSSVRPDDVLEATEHPSHYEFTVDGKKRLKPGSKRTTVVIAKFKAQRYRVQIRTGGEGHDTIFIGFDSLSSNLFTADDF